MTIFNQPPPKDTVHYSKAQLDSLIPTFAPKLIDWANAHGRHDLPWQQHRTDTPDIYAIWLSEIMLQQTQVATVKGYFSRFVQQFADVHSLANADWDEVANLWAGLGYYARARNLHAGARQLSDFVQTHGHFPKTLEQWCAIKGVGRSTAGAVLSMGVGVFGVICDANVKRVLARIFAVNAPIDKHEKQFWHLATALTPVGKNIDTAYHSGRYAQAIMDLGALICQKNPKCDQCPVRSDCQAYAQGNPSQYPIKSMRNKKTRHSLALVLCHADGVLWQMRPKRGIWGGLWGLPIIECDAKGQAKPSAWDDFLLSSPNPIWHKHTLTHIHWQLGAVYVPIDDNDFARLHNMPDCQFFSVPPQSAPKILQSIACTNLRA